MNLSDDILQIQAENDYLRNLVNEQKAEIQLEISRNSQFLKIQEDMDFYYRNVISDYHVLNQKIIDDILNCREQISVLQGKKQNLQYIRQQRR